MATIAPEVLRWEAKEWEKAIPSAVLSGIVGDRAHRLTPSKHNSREDNPSGSWPTRAGNDKKGPTNTASAIDMTMSKADMVKVHKRFRAVYLDKNDPRRPYLAAFNGWDGQGVPGRYDLVNNTITTTDRSHEWHEHVEGYYAHTGTDPESWKAARARISIVRGLNGAQWLAEESKLAGGDEVSKKEVIDALDDVVPYASNAGKRLAEKGWNPISTRVAVEYIMEGVVNLNSSMASLAESVAKVGEMTGLDSAELEKIRALQVPPELIADAIVAELASTNVPTVADILANGLGSPERIRELAALLAEKAGATPTA